MFSYLHRLLKPTNLPKIKKLAFLYFDYSLVVFLFLFRGNYSRTNWGRNLKFCWNANYTHILEYLKYLTCSIPSLPIFRTGDSFPSNLLGLASPSPFYLGLFKRDPESKPQPHIIQSSSHPVARLQASTTKPGNFFEISIFSSLFISIASGWRFFLLI